MPTISVIIACYLHKRLLKRTNANTILRTYNDFTNRKQQVKELRQNLTEQEPQNEQEGKRRGSHERHQRSTPPKGLDPRH